MLTAVFDTVMIATGLFHYAPTQLAGVHIGLAPLEDFAYPLAGVLLLPPRCGPPCARADPGRAPPQTGRSTHDEKTSRGGIGHDIAQILLSSRPISWINTAFPFAAAYLLSTREIDATFVIGTLYFLVPYNLAMYGINDVFDYASDLANPARAGSRARCCPRASTARRCGRRPPRTYRSWSTSSPSAPRRRGCGSP